MPYYSRGRYRNPVARRSSKFRSSFRRARVGRAPIARASMKYAGKGYHPFGMVSRPYSSIPSDYKSVDVAYNLTPVAGGGMGGGPGVLFLMNGTIAGAGFYQRIGRQICMKALKLQYALEPTLENTANVGRMRQRLMVIYDRQPNGAGPTAQQILSNYVFNAAAGGNASPWAYLNPTQKDRFVVLKDIALTTPPISAAGAPQADGWTNSVQINNQNAKDAGSFQAANGSIYLNLKNLMTTYTTSTSGGITDIQTGGLYFFCINEDTAAAATAAWGVECSARLTFTDC